MRKIKIIMINVFVLTFLSIISCKENREKTPDELKMELQMLEENTPLQYLELVQTTIQRNKIKEAGLFSSAKYDGYLITGKVKNSATLAKFKDLKLMVEFYSQTKTIIESKSYVKYEYFKPNTTKEFTLKVYPPEAMKGFGVYVIEASPTYE
jgi:hypothetical protein